MAKNISRYRVSVGDEGQDEPGSRGRVLKNLLGIKSKREMDRVENEALKATDDYYSNHLTDETVFTVDLIREMHQRFLGKIYAWAGKNRTVNLTKGSFTWPPPNYLDSSLAEFEHDFLQRLTPLHPAPLETIANSIAAVHAEFLIIHPFRDGNGRIARLIAKLMALQAGQSAPYYGFTGKGSREQKSLYLDAVLRGYNQNYEPLARFFAGAIKRGEVRWLRSGL